MATLTKANTNGSVAITLPKCLVEALGWVAGDKCTCKLCPDGGIIVNKVDIKNMKKEKKK